MPHLLLKLFSLPPMPAEVEGVKFLFHAPPFIGVEAEGVRFLLQLKERDGKLLLKYEKRTRPLLKTLKKAYLAFLKWTGAEVEWENISGIKEKPLSPYLLKIGDDFSDIDIVEIGFGSGRHLLQLAKEFKNKTILGIEIYNPAIEQVLRRLKVEGVKNVRVVNCDARLLLSRIPSNRLEQVHLHFPIPWEENPEKRVVTPQFLEELIRTLQVGGIFHLRTDSPLYRDWTLKLLMELPRVEVAVRKNFQYRVVSKYEARWNRLKRDIFDIIVRNWEESPPKEGEFNFKFTHPLCSLKPTTLKRDRFLIHIEQLYPIEGGGELVRLAMGPYDRVEGIFIVNGPEGCYYFKEPAPVEENWEAHQELQRVFRCPN